jgi:single-stranded-DNA-specific exonuclease
MDGSAAASADVLVLADAHWHAGVVGLVASRLVERFHRPAFVFAPGGDDGLWRGSARSIPGLHLRDAIALTDARHPGLIERFGGHAMAAGMSVKPSALPALQLALTECVGSLLDAQLLDKQVWTDGSLAPNRLDLATAELLRTAGPYGQQFAPPLFDDVFIVLDSKLLKGRHRKLRVRHREGGQPLDALWFNSGERELPGSGAVRLLYTLEPSEYRGLWTPQLLVQYAL